MSAKLVINFSQFLLGEYFFSGRRVAGFVPSGALATMISANKSGIVAVPDDWSLSDAATVPVVYGTVLYALLVVSVKPYVLVIQVSHWLFFILLRKPG